LSKGSKSKRFSQQGASAVKKHDEIFTYRTTMAETTKRHEDAENQTLGGF